MSEFFLKIINMSISASWLVLAVLLLRLILKKAPKWFSVFLWGIVAVRLICPFSLESALSLIPSAETVSPDIMMDWTPEIATGVDPLDRLVNPMISASFAPEPYASANPLQLLIPVCGNLWALGVLVMLLYTTISYLLLRHKVSTAVLLRGNIYQSEQVDSPFVLGIVRPRIYLPFSLDGQHMDHIIAHEMAHIHRKDHWWKPLGFVLLAIHWFNPLVWLGYVLLCRDIELACDERVIKKLDREAKADYTQALVNSSVSRRRIAACPLAFGEVGVKARVKSVLYYKKPAFWLVGIAVVVCLAVAVCFLTNPPKKLGETNPEKLTQTQKTLMEAYPDYFGLDATDGLDVYVWQMSEGSYSFGLQPHRETQPDMWSAELRDMKSANAEQMREILSTYAVAREDITIVLWQNPFSGYLPDYLIAENGEDPKAKAEAYAEKIGKYLFGEETAEDTQPEPLENARFTWPVNPDVQIDRIVLHNLYTRKKTEITDPQAVAAIVDYFAHLDGKAEGTTRGWYGGAYNVKFMGGQTEVLNFGFCEPGGRSDPTGHFSYGYSKDNTYPIRYVFQNMTGSDAVAFLNRYE